MRRHLVLAAFTLVATALAFVALPQKDPIQRASMSTAYVSLGLLVACLVLGPWNVLRGRPNPVSTHVRRDLGIWGGAVALVHVAVGLNVHLRGRPWLYFIYDRGDDHLVPLRHDIFGFANYTGLAAGVILGVLLAISNDAALRRLGTGRWKRWQRWNYAATALLVAHGIAFQVIETRVWPIVLLCAVALLFALAMQLAGVARARRGA